MHITFEKYFKIAPTQRITDPNPSGPGFLKRSEFSTKILYNYSVHPNGAFQIETSRLIYTANQITVFYMK